MLTFCIAAAVLTAIAATISGGLRFRAYAYLKLLPLIFISAALLLVFPLQVSWVLMAYFAFCALGDGFLLWPERGFNLGLLSFLVAHGLMLWQLQSIHSLDVTQWLVVFFIAIALALSFTRWMGIKSRKRFLAVSMYASVLLCVLIVSAYVSVTFSGSMRYAFFCALLFTVSDTLLAINKFKYPWSSAQWGILPSYYGAQLAWAWVWMARV